MFRRRSQDSPTAATALAEPEQTGRLRDPQAPKGRPTPKRSEAQAGRRTRVTTPKDRKEAAKEARARMRAEREKQRLALVSGDERYLPARDKGPLRRFVRDFVDSRFTVAEWFLPLAVLIMVLSALRNVQLQTLGIMLWLLVIVAIVLDSVRHVVALRKRLRQRFPNESHKGLTAYALLRTMQIRRMRLPKPQVARRAKL